jgi:serine/threonine protein kinase
VTIATEIRRGTLVDNRYRIQRVLGQGGFGRTYLVSDQRRFDEFCVLKEFVPNTTAQYLIQRARELFQREAKILYELDHPQIPKFLAWFEENERLFLIQEYVDGKTYSDLLRDRISQGKTFSETEVIQWLKDVLPVLDYLHSCNIIHRDISPDNLMLPSLGTKPVLIDLGVVKQVMSEVRSGSLRSTANTGYALLVGKVGFSPPEQIDLGQCYPSSDLYALAVSVLVLLTGKQPNEQVNREAWFGDDLKISDRLARIIAKMLAENPLDRYQSAKAVLHELQQLSFDYAPQPVHLPTATPNPSHKSTLLQAKTVLQERGKKAQKIDFSKIFPLNFKFSPMGSIATSIMVSVLLFGGLSLTFLSPYIAVVCNVLDNCAKDKEYEAIYAHEVSQGKQLLLEIEQTQSIEALKDIREKLSLSMIQLSRIPQNAQIYSASKEAMGDYQNLLEIVQNKLDKENLAEQQLTSIDRLTNEATRTTDTADTIVQYQKAKAEWQKVQRQLQTVPSDASVNDKVQEQLAQANRHIKNLQSEIERQVTQAEQRLEKVAQQAKTQNTNLEMESRQEAAMAPLPSSPPIISPPPPTPTRQTASPVQKSQPPATPAVSARSTPIPVPSPSSTVETTTPISRAASAESQSDLAIGYANDLVYGLAIAARKKQINYGTRTYRQVQNTVRLLRRGATLEDAVKRSQVPLATIEQLLAWGQNRPSRRIEN